VIARVFYGPPDWLVAKFDTRDRRAFGFWTLVLSVAAFPFFGSYVVYVSVLSLIALVPNFSAETPVEVESGDD
jgi:hypothetical protein